MRGSGGPLLTFSNFVVDGGDGPLDGGTDTSVPSPPLAAKQLEVAPTYTGCSRKNLAAPHALFPQLPSSIIASSELLPNSIDHGFTKSHVPLGFAVLLPVSPAPPFSSANATPTVLRRAVVLLPSHALPSSSAAASSPRSSLVAAASNPRSSSLTPSRHHGSRNLHRSHAAAALKASESLIYNPLEKLATM